MKFLALIMLLPNLAFAQTWDFNVLMDDKPLGQHRFELSESGLERTLTSEASFKIQLLFITAYKYQHSAREKWQGDCLVYLDAKTEEKGVTTLVKGQSRTGGFELESPARTLPGCVMTFAYWNSNMLTQSKLLNPQTGEWVDVNISKIGTETLQVRGQNVPTERYSLKSKMLKIDLWYSKEGKWLALKSTTPEGHVITYELK
ncbi:MAG: DUF6134 family protein [Methylophilaceae bacterium]